MNFRHLISVWAKRLGGSRPTLQILIAGVVNAGIAAPLEVPFGIHGPHFSHEYRDETIWPRAQADFDSFHQLGVNFARMDIWWGRVEPVQGSHEFSWFDRAIDLYERNGVRLMPILCYGSAWHHADAPVDDATRQAFGDYVHAVVSRYRGTVHEWEVWNEPNILPFWSPEPNAADYAAVLEIAHSRAKEADPDCMIVAGATSQPDVAFWEGIFDAGAGDSFDVLSYHTYSAHPPRREIAMEEVRRMRALLDRHGREDAPIWMSETGMDTGPRRYTEEEHARHLIRGTIWRLAAGAERCVYLAMTDWQRDDETCGLMTFDREPKQAWHAVRTFADAVRGRGEPREVQLGPEVEAFLFGGRHDNALAIWAREGSAEITLDAGVTHLLVESMTGSEELRTSADRTFVLPLTENPTWLHNVGDNLVLLSRTTTEPQVHQRGDEVELVTRIENPFSRETTFRADVEIDADLIHASRSDERSQGLNYGDVRLGPGEQGRITLGFALRDDAAFGDHVVPVNLYADERQVPLGRAAHHAQITVEEPFLVTPVEATELDAEGQLPLLFLVENHSSPLTLEVSGEAAGASVEMEVLIEEATAEISVPVDLSTASSNEAIRARLTFRGANHESSAEHTQRYFLVPREASPGESLAAASSGETLGPHQFSEFNYDGSAGGAQDQAVRAWLAWSPEGLSLAVHVSDDQVVLPASREVWDFDGLQIALDPLNDGGRAENWGPDDMEFEIGLGSSGEAIVWAGRYPAGRPAEVVADNASVSIQATETGLTYALFFPAPILDPLRFEPGAMFGLTLLHNDNDGAGREGWLELSPGIGLEKKPELYPTFILRP